MSKLAAEGYCRAFTQVYGLETVAVRYFNVFGPRQDPLSQYAAVIPRFITAALRGESPVIFGDGEQSRDFTYIDNTVEGTLLASTAEGVAGETFNVACGEATSLNQLVEYIGQISGKPLEAGLRGPVSPATCGARRPTSRRRERRLGSSPRSTSAPGSNEHSSISPVRRRQIRPAEPKR